MQIRTVEIEFTEDTYGADGEIKRNKGDRMYVDKVSAHSFVDDQGRRQARRRGSDAGTE